MQHKTSTTRKDNANTLVEKMKNSRENITKTVDQQAANNTNKHGLDKWMTPSEKRF
jgi:hypothetical protein